MQKFPIAVLTGLFLISACAQQDADQIATIVAATLQASSPTQTAPAVEAIVTPEEQPTLADTAQQPEATGSISGSLSYPSEFIPAMQVVAFGLLSNDWYVVDTVEGSGTYQLDNLPAGLYQVVSYLVGGDYGGGYTAAVSCGLSVDCNDHALIAVEVTPGQVTTEINPGDWYAPEGTFPPNPNP